MGCDKYLPTIGLFGEVDPWLDPPFLLFFCGLTVTLPAEIESIVLAVLDRHDCDLVQGMFFREKNGRVLRLLIERRGTDPDRGSGVDLGLCSEVSREVGETLEVGETIDTAYVLEVSSPGIERPLVKREDFERFAGRSIVLKTKRAIEGRRRFKGILKGQNDGIVTIKLKGGQTVSIPDDLVQKANLVFEPNELGAKVGD
jgi:ribosome maturation factor RimP